MRRFCTNCGQAIEDKMNNCPNCGIRLKNKETFNEDKNVKNNNVNYKTVNKSRTCAGVLAILLGSLGVHNFYLGYNGKAITQLLMSILSCGFLGTISGIWSFIEGILLLTGSINVDGRGNPLGL